MQAKAVALLIVLVLSALCRLAPGAEPPQRSFELTGRVEPEVQASVSLHGAITPFSASTLSDARGRFRFTRLEAGQYTLSAFAPGYGEKRTTIDIGPSTAADHGKFEAVIRLEGTSRETIGGKVSAAELAVPPAAWRLYSEAQKRLSKRDVDGAVERLKKAVAMTPRFTAAWNNLGTISYQTQRYPDAEQYFRKALEVDPSAFEPLVNLGGVLLTLNKVDEAYSYNLYAVLRRPTDALANSQLGMNYFGLGKLDLAEKYLREAQRLDPAHFSHPQLLLAEIYLRRRENAKAADVLEDFLRYHPDWKDAPRIREAVARLRGR